MYREIRVRPVVRYVVTEYQDGNGRRGTVQLGEYNSVSAANQVAIALAYKSRIQDEAQTVFEAARGLRIDTIRGDSAPKTAIRYTLREVANA